MFNSISNIFFVIGDSRNQINEFLRNNINEEEGHYSFIYPKLLIRADIYISNIDISLLVISKGYMTLKSASFLKDYKKTLMSGFYTFIILLLMEKLDKPTYGYELAKMVESLSNGEFKLPVGTMYPILKKLQSKKLVRSFWAESKDGPPRKYYELTEAGKEFLDELKDFWLSLKEFMGKLL